MAGGVVNGQAVSQEVTNPAFLYKNADDQMPNQLDFTRAASGDDVIDIQSNVNELNARIGRGSNDPGLPVGWADNEFGLVGDNHQERIEAIVAAVKYRAGSVPIPDGQDFVDVVFSDVWPDANYVPVFSLECSDASPIFLIGFIPTANIVAAGFRVKFNAAVDSGNYTLHYRVGVVR